MTRHLAIKNLLNKKYYNKRVPDVRGSNNEIHNTYSCLKQDKDRAIVPINYKVKKTNIIGINILQTTNTLKYNNYILQALRKVRIGPGTFIIINK